MSCPKCGFVPIISTECEHGMCPNCCAICAVELKMKTQNKRISNLESEVVRLSRELALLKCKVNAA